MAATCAWCHTTDMLAGGDLSQCVNCGLFTTAEGEKAVPTSESNEGVTVSDITPPEIPDTTEPEPVPDPVVTADEASAEQADAPEAVPDAEPASTPDTTPADAAPPAETPAEPES